MNIKTTEVNFKLSETKEKFSNRIKKNCFVKKTMDLAIISVSR